MRIALCTTTIHDPEVLKVYRAQAPDSINFFVTGDLKSPDEDIRRTLTECMPAAYYSVQSQQVLEYKCSELIGWNCLQRRNIAFLEALKWGANTIVTIDDDNIPLGAHFSHIRGALGYSFSGIMFDGHDGWFDPGALIEYPAKARGIPEFIDLRKNHVSAVRGKRVGVAAGIILGDPDIDAVTRIAQSPFAFSVAEIARTGAIVNPAAHTVFNSQNTAFLAELAPCMFMMPGVGRHDDIYASLITQRVMRERDLHVHFGLPFVYQQRNKHDLIVDLELEISGMKHVRELAALLDSIVLPGKSILEDTRAIYAVLSHVDYIPPRAVRAAFAYLDDCEELFK